MIFSFYLRKVSRILNLGLELRLVGSTRIGGNCDLAPLPGPFLPHMSLYTKSTPGKMRWQSPLDWFAWRIKST